MSPNEVNRVDFEPPRCFVEITCLTEGCTSPNHAARLRRSPVILVSFTSVPVLAVLRRCNEEYAALATEGVLNLPRRLKRAIGYRILLPPFPRRSGRRMAILTGACLRVNSELAEAHQSIIHVTDRCGLRALTSRLISRRSTACVV